MKVKEAVPSSPYGLCGRKAKLDTREQKKKKRKKINKKINKKKIIVQELCES